ncbi:MAG: adenylate/guanylate cyclase domain-containing protein [Actinobacteria bacterium]|nr:adenylate/guanylate cyclase domain-containing protein [Actinomycetota bacterium]
MAPIGLPPIATLPDDPRLRQMAETLERTRLTAALCDHEWRLVWVSAELKKMLDEQDEGKLGYGNHIVECFLSETWSRTVSDSSKANFAMVDLPRIAHDTPDGVKRISNMIKAAFGQQDSNISFESEVPAPIWTSEFDFIQGDLPPLKVASIYIRLHEEAGPFFGTAIVFDQSLPATITTLILRGDEGMFERMVRLYEPGRRAAALLFADLEASTMLSRKMASSAYFHLVRAITTNIDEVVVRHLGIVGKHAGDGVTAFFLAEDTGSPSQAAKAAIRAAKEMARACSAAVEQYSRELGGDEEIDCFINVGVHWGPTLYMGQLVTGGRLEVTALGDEVNEAARIQQSAQGGEVLASKSLLEQLDSSDAEALGINPDAIRYRLLEEMPGATEKAVRDAGVLPVAVIPSEEDLN